MRKLVFLVIALLGLGYTAAWNMPGFWAMVPAQYQAKIPPQYRASLNMPAQVALAPAPAKNGGGQNGGGQAGAGGGGQGRPTPVTLGQAQKKSMPVRVDAIGTVQTIASVTVRPRVDSQIEEVLFKDGAMVKSGDVLVRLDDRAILAQIKQVEANIQRDRATLDLARRTLKRGEELADANFATKQRLDENRSAVTVQEATLKSNEAALENLKTQLSYYTIRAPISGKAGLANLKPGNIAQSAAAATAITTINQVSPIYVAFFLPQRHFQELKESIDRGDSVVEATPQGGTRSAKGKLALIENAVDNNTGTIGVRAVFENDDEILWPGAIVNARVTLRMEDNVITVPREAVQMSQRGSYVFVVRDGVARMQPVKTGRGVDREQIIESGLNGDESIVIDGQLLVTDGARVQQRTQGGGAAQGGQGGGQGGGRQSAG